MSGLVVQPTADMIAEIPNRILPQILGAGNDQALDDTSPNDLPGGPTYRHAMGKIGQQRQVSVLIDNEGAGAAPITIVLWLFNFLRNKWVKGGSTVDKYTQDYDDLDGCMDAIRGAVDAYWYLTANQEVLHAIVADGGDKLHYSDRTTPFS